MISMSVIIDTSLNCYILYSFTQSLILRIGDETNNIREINANRPNNRWLDHATRYFILLSFSIITSCLFLVFAIISCISHLARSDHTYYWFSERPLDVNTDYIWQIDCLCNAYCIFFEREYAKKYYNRCCLSFTKIHHLVKFWFQRWAVKRRRRTNNYTCNEYQQPLSLSVDQDH